MGCPRSGAITYSRFATTPVMRQRGGSLYALSAVAYGGSWTVEGVRFNLRVRTWDLTAIVALARRARQQLAARKAGPVLDVRVPSAAARAATRLTLMISATVPYAQIRQTLESPDIRVTQIAAVTRTPAGAARDFRLHKSGEKWTVVERGLLPCPELSEQRRIQYGCVICMVDYVGTPMGRPFAIADRGCDTKLLPDDDPEVECG
ncbi:hypothetical protein VTO73DRAFT_13820 [Trametes versicolor]